MSDRYKINGLYKDKKNKKWRVLFGLDNSNKYQDDDEEEVDELTEKLDREASEADDWLKEQRIKGNR